MSIEELQTILAFSTTKKNQKVIINAKYGDGTLEHCDIISFDSYSDAIVLNTKTTFGKHWKPTKEQLEALKKVEEFVVMEKERNQENAHLYVTIKSLKEDLYKL